MLIKNGIVSSSSCFAKRGAGCGGLYRGRAYCLPFFFFLCFGKTVLKECQEKNGKEGERAGCDFFIELSTYLKMQKHTAGYCISHAI